MNSLVRFCKYIKGNPKFDADKVKIAIEEIVASGENSPSALASILIRDYGYDADEMHRSVAKYYAFGEVNVNPDALDKNQICLIKFLHERIDHALLNRLLDELVFPYKLVGKKLDVVQVLVSDTTLPIIRSLEELMPFKTIEISWAPKATIISLIEKSKLPIEFCQIMRKSEQTILDSGKPADKLDNNAIEEEINKGFLQELFDNVLVDAVRNDASDIHIIPSGKKSVEIYIRIDGKLKLWLRRENTPEEAVAAVVKDRTLGVDRFIQDRAQDGDTQKVVDGHLIRFRISVLPMVSKEFDRRFESIVIRVIDDRKVIEDFHKLGFLEQAETELQKAINSYRGIVIVTGPTGSGKSTTLYAALKQIMEPSLNVLTCEDPVEYVIDGARQLKIGHNMSFDEAMRSILRHDPDVVMVGEIRDKVTADIAVKLANTGHLTLTTLHTNNAPSAITRLYKMGIEPFILAYSINIIVAQRLVRKLCDHCKQPLTEDMYESAMSLGLSREELESGNIYMPVGCSKCTDGYKGRICLVEALYFYPEIRAEIIRSASEIDEDKIRKIAENHGMLSMRESGLERVRAGSTSITEVLHTTSDI
ncbi:GspE/PulE family protein [Candidatus Cloacimonadaceae bacterium]